MSVITFPSGSALLFVVFDNFPFLQSTYNSAARDLTDDFIFGKLNAKFFRLFDEDKELGLKKEGCRSAARRFAHIVSDEFGFCFIDTSLTSERLQKHMTKFTDRAIKNALPALLKMSKLEERG